MDRKTLMARRPGGEAAIRARLAASPGLSDTEAHTLAGLLDAESHLAIGPSNGGSIWRCLCRVTLRDDDQDILLGYRDKLGLGHLVPVAARGGSRPQACWTIVSKLECRLLTEVLDAHPLRGRKQREYEIWREATILWASTGQGAGPGVRARLAELAEYLRAERIYRAPRADARLPDMTDQYAASYFAGFFSGEGSFALQPRSARFVIKLRRDDRPLLEAFRRDFGIGSVRDVRAQEPWSPAAVWHVTGARDVLAGIQLFDSTPLLGRKARQYEAWRPGAQAIAEAVVARTPLDGRLVESAREAFAQASAYRRPVQPVRVESGLPAARAAFLGVLKQWAREFDRPLSETAYAAARREGHPEWPTRNAIAETFGGWYGALHAAGLAHRAARPRRTAPRRVRLDRLHPDDAEYRAAVVRRLRGLLR
jgi:hypothetical protein